MAEKTVVSPSAKPLLVAVEEQDPSLVREIIPTSPHRDINLALRLCIAHRESIDTLRLILQSGPAQTLIDEEFLRIAWSGVFPKTVQAMLPFISPYLQRDLYRIQAQAKREGDKSFYFPSFIEEDRYKEIFSKLLPQRMAQRKKSLIQNQLWINDLFLCEVLCDHRLIVAELLSLKAGYPRPCPMTLAQALVLLLSRDHYHLASLLIEYEEGPVEDRTDLQINQFGADYAFNEMLDTQDLAGLQFLLSRVAIRPDQTLIDAAYRQFADRIYVNRLVRDRLRGLRYKTPQLLGKWTRYWTRYFGQFEELLRRHVPPDVIEAVREQQRRQQLRQQRRNVLIGMGTDIHAFSASRITMPGEGNADGDGGEGTAMALDDVDDGDWEDVGGDVDAVGADAAADGGGADGAVVQEEPPEEGGPVPAPVAQAPAVRNAPPARKQLIDVVSDFIARKLQLPPLTRDGHPARRFREVPAAAAAATGATVTGAVDAAAGDAVATVLPSIVDVEEDITRRINRLFPSPRDRADAIQKLTSGIDHMSQQLLVRVWFYLHERNVAWLDTWLHGFLGEAVAVNSCSPGVAERIVTGLRGLGDTELDAIFAQAEGPLLARMFLNNAFNFALANTMLPPTMHTARSLANESRDVALQRRRAMDLATFLVETGGITTTSSMEQVTAALRRYAEDGVRGFHVNPTQFAQLIEVVVELAVDSYDDCLRSFVEAQLAQRVEPVAAGNSSAQPPQPPAPSTGSAGSTGSTAADAR